MDIIKMKLDNAHQTVITYSKLKLYQITVFVNV